MKGSRQRKQLWWAVIASLLLHLVVAFVLVAFNAAFAPAPVFVADDRPSELTVVDLSSVAEPTPPRNPGYLETDPSKESAQPPKEQTFESNANSVAASKAAPTGEAPLPSQEGRELPTVQMENQQLSLASQGGQPQPPIPPAATPSTPTPAPAQTPTPQPTPRATATPLPEPLATPTSEQLAMLTGTPPPPIRDPQETEASPPPEVATTPPVVAPRPLPERPSSAYRQQKEETKITGRITNRGASAADAVATPLGRYKKAIQDAVGSRWYYYVVAKSDLASIGTARVTAEIDAQGHVRNLRIVSNSANEAFANICLQSFQEAQIPPIPPDLAAALPDGRMPLEFSFTFF